MVDGIRLLAVPAATFWMGCNHAAANQAPAHRVRIGAFSMMEMPVSRALYQRFLDETGHPCPPFWEDPRYAGDDLPAVGPSWEDAVACAAWLSARTGLALRLPTEAEREWAASGGNLETIYPWGNRPLLGERLERPPRLGSTPPNRFSLHHMADGVHEWCSDWYGADYYRSSPLDDPRGPTSGTRRVGRGGSWRHHVPVTPTRARSSLPPDHRYADFGFRLVMGR